MRAVLVCKIVVKLSIGRDPALFGDGFHKSAYRKVAEFFLMHEIVNDRALACAQCPRNAYDHFLIKYRESGISKGAARSIEE